MTKGMNTQWKVLDEKEGVYYPVFPYARADGVMIGNGKFLSDLLNGDGGEGTLPLLNKDGSLDIKKQGENDNAVVLLSTVKNLLTGGLVTSETVVYDSAPPHTLTIV